MNGLRDITRFIVVYGIMYVLFMTLPKFADSLSRRIYRRMRRGKYLKSRIFEIDKMSGEEFEEFLEAHFHSLGYSTKLTKSTNDYGADLIAKKKNETIVIQAKRYKGKIGNKAIQEVIGAKGYYGATKCMVITNSFFTSNAINLAKCNNVELWDRNKIVEITKR